jgi:AcrR family transcriptional regulator
MSPRRYCLGQRQVAADQTRARILAAARELLTAGGSFTGFTVDAVARQAGVARMTVYHQFGSKMGLLEAMFDDVAARGQIRRLAESFARPDALDALSEFIATFGRFWGSDRLLIRRLRALAALDPDFARALATRDERRRECLRVLLRRLPPGRGRPSAAGLADAVDVVHTLTSFETFDALAGAAHGPQDVTPLVQRLVRCALGLSEG